MTIDRDSVYNRLKTQCKNIGLSDFDSSLANSENAAYAYAIGSVADDFRRVLEEMFVDTAQNVGLSMWGDLAGVDISDADTAKAQIIKQISSAFSPITSDDFYEAVASELNNSVVSFSSFEAVFSFDGDDIELCPVIGETADKYLPCMTEPKLTGSGKSFDMWDARAISFSGFNKLLCPWSIIDTLTEDE